jgi:hypothetical protein
VSSVFAIRTPQLAVAHSGPLQAAIQRLLKLSVEIDHARAIERKDLLGFKRAVDALWVYALRN